MKIELFFTPGCAKCAGATTALKAAAETMPGIEWREVNVLDDLDRAVDLGCRAGRRAFGHHRGGQPRRACAPAARSASAFSASPF